jgi:hypothetical protein
MNVRNMSAKTNREMAKSLQSPFLAQSSNDLFLNAQCYIACLPLLKEAPPPPVRRPTSGVAAYRLLL